MGKRTAAIEQIPSSAIVTFGQLHSIVDYQRKFVVSYVCVQHSGKLGFFPSADKWPQSEPYFIRFVS